MGFRNIRLLVVCHDIGLSASGIMVDAFIKAFKLKGVDLLVLAQNVDTDYNHTEWVISSPFKVGLNRFDKIKYIFFNTDTRYNNWRDMLIANYSSRLKEFSPSNVLGFGSGQTDLIPKLTVQLSKILNTPYHIHTFDAVPSPECWGANKYLRKAIGKSVCYHYFNAGSLTTTNPKMLEYLNNYHNLKASQPKDVIYNPVGISNVNPILPRDGYFLYLGSLDSKRNAPALFKAINRLNKSGFEMKFVFVGTSKKLIASNYSNNIIPKNIVILPFTKEVDKVISESLCLIDIDISEMGDVYLSSKLIKYISTNRKILSITPKHSPAYNLFSKNCLEDVHIVHHDEDRLYSTLCSIWQDPTPLQIQTNRHIFSERLNVNHLASRLLKVMVSADEGK